MNTMLVRHVVITTVLLCGSRECVEGRGDNGPRAQLLTGLAAWEKASETRPTFSFDSTISPSTKYPRFDHPEFIHLMDVVGPGHIPAMLELLQEAGTDRDVYRLCLVIVIERITKRTFLDHSKLLRIADYEACRKQLLRGRDAAVAWWKGRDKHKDQFLADYADFKDHLDAPGGVLTVTTRSIDRKTGQVRVKEELTDLGKAHAALRAYGIEALPWMAELIGKGDYALVDLFVEMSGYLQPPAGGPTKAWVEGFLLVWWKSQRAAELTLPDVSAAKLK